LWGVFKDELEEAKKKRKRIKIKKMRRIINLLL
jgi:hypothetical protein